MPSRTPDIVYSYLCGTLDKQREKYLTLDDNNVKYIEDFCVNPNIQRIVFLTNRNKIGHVFILYLMRSVITRHVDDKMGWRVTPS